MAAYLSGHVLAVRAYRVIHAILLKFDFIIFDIMKSPMHSFEDQIATLCIQLHQQNQHNIDPVSKAVRTVALNAIEQNVKTLHSHPLSCTKPSIPPIQNFKKLYRMIHIALSFLCLSIIIHTVLLVSGGLVPHLTAYTCSSLIQNNYAQFDFIGIPSLMKGASCIGLIYVSYLRYQPVMMFVHNVESPLGFGSDIYHVAVDSGQKWYTRNHSVVDTYLYQDIAIMADYTGWAMDTVWYTCTHSASDSTRIFVKWLNKKTKIIVAIRDAFIELPVIKQVREAVKAVEDTVDHYVIHPIREKVKEGAQCLMNGLSYFGRRLIQWSKRSEIGEKPKSVEDPK
jgi:hypothetical protein